MEEMRGADVFFSCGGQVRLADREYLSLIRRLNVNENSGDSKKVLLLTHPFQHHTPVASGRSLHESER